MTNCYVFTAHQKTLQLNKLTLSSRDRRVRKFVWR